MHSPPVTSVCRNCRWLCCCTGLSYHKITVPDRAQAIQLRSLFVVTAEHLVPSLFIVAPAAVLRLSTRQTFGSSALKRSYSASGWGGLGTFCRDFEQIPRNSVASRVYLDLKRDELTRDGENYILNFVMFI